MGKTIFSTKLSDTISLTLCTDGYWLYDFTRCMNLSMRAKTEQAAFVEALTYYQRRLEDIESCYNSLQSRVDTFVSQFVEDYNEEE